MRAAAAASGTLMKKIQRQLAASISQPPRNGPMALATPANPDQAPTAAARSSVRKVAAMMDKLPGTSSAPPAPWRPRAATKNPTDGDNPQSAEATTNDTS